MRRTSPAGRSPWPGGGSGTRRRRSFGLRGSMRSLRACSPTSGVRSGGSLRCAGDCVAFRRHRWRARRSARRARGSSRAPPGGAGDPASRRMGRAYDRRARDRSRLLGQCLEAGNERDRCDDAAGGGKPGSSRRAVAGATGSARRDLRPPPSDTGAVWIDTNPSSAWWATTTRRRSKRSRSRSWIRHSRPRSSVSAKSPTLAHPLGPAAKPILLADAPSALRAPVVLPDCSFVHPSDAASVWGASLHGESAVPTRARTTSFSSRTAPPLKRG
jgi:hypothetical protein